MALDPQRVRWREDTPDCRNLVALSAFDRLRERGINTSASRREYAVIDSADKRTASVLRISPHYYTEEEIERAVVALGELVR